jgi:hypothetical protein
MEIFEKTNAGDEISVFAVGRAGFLFGFNCRPYGGIIQSLNN